MDHEFHHFADKGKTSAGVAYARVVEATTGAKGQGHPHIHVWVVAPYLPRVWLQHMWGCALKAAGCPVQRPGKPRERDQIPIRDRDEAIQEGTEGLINNERLYATEVRKLDRLFRTRRGIHGRPLDHVYAPMVDIRKADTSLSDELVKYLVKDAYRSEDGELHFIDPQMMSRLYIALRGVRTFQASRGLCVAQKGATVACGCCFSIGEWTMKRCEAPPRGLAPPGVAFVYPDEQEAAARAALSAFKQGRNAARASSRASDHITIVV